MSDREPLHRGEREVKSLLDSYCAEPIKYWFSLDYIPGMSDLDLLLLDKRSGLFAIEIKAVPISEIEEISLSSIFIRGRGKKKSTNEQAYSALIGLLSHAKKYNVVLPFAVATSMWPKISRAEWNSSFRDNPEIRDLSERMLFEEDLITYSRLQNRLTKIYREPPIRSGSSRDYSFDAAHLEQLYQLVNQKTVAPQKPTFTKFQLIARTQRNTTLKKYPLNQPLRLVLEGIPGSGKTYSLLTLAQLHGSEGRSVLMLCFNKALAAQLRVNVKSISEELKDPELVEFIQVMDIFQHARVCSETFGIQEEITYDNYYEWLDLILEGLKNSELNNPDFPDVLLVDEVQDFSTIEQKWIEYWASNSRWVALAKGLGQEVYSHQVNPNLSWVKEFKKERLTKNYRNPGRLFLLSNLIGNAKFNPDNLRQVERVTLSKLKTRELSVDRLEESGLKLKFVDDNDEPSLIENYTEIILDAISALEGKNTEHFQLLILVRGSADRRRCQRVMNDLKQSNYLDYLDLTDERNRRIEPTSNQVRLCTYESARGLEADAVIVIGFELLCMNDEKDANLALVSLSRAVSDCTITIKKERASYLPKVLDEFLTRVDRIIEDI